MLMSMTTVLMTELKLQAKKPFAVARNPMLFPVVA